MPKTDLLPLSEHTPEQTERRFGGIARLYGDAGLANFMRAHICIIGIGGVGSWLAESLARSAIGALTLIDMDVVAVSNINRQIVASESQVGRDKGLVMRDRINDINPSCEVAVVDEFINADNLSELLSTKYTYVVDCIDDFRTKAALINFCRQKKIKLLCIGGAGGQSDPSKIKQTDLSRTQHDVLLAKTRKLLRQDFGFARNPKRSMSVPCVYSDEQLVYPDGRGGLSAQRPAPDASAGVASNALNCAGGIGSVTHVTGSFAFFAAAYLLKQLANAEPSSA